MILGTLQFELLIHGAESLKDKRRVVKSLKDRLHREHLVSVAEIARLDAMEVAVLGLAVVGHEGKTVAGVLDRIAGKLRALLHAEVGSIERKIIRVDEHTAGLRESAEPMSDEDRAALAAELAAYAADLGDLRQDDHGQQDLGQDDLGQDLDENRGQRR